METTVTVTDDSAVLVGLIATLAVLLLILVVAITVCLTLGMAYNINRRRGKFQSIEDFVYSS
jgi:signal transduction histidine kinase